MTRYCVVRALNTEWIITSALDERECGIQGGVIENRDASSGGCGSTTVAAQSYKGFSESGVAGRTSALALVPLRLFRATFEQSPVVAQLDQLNQLAASEMEEVFLADVALGENVRDMFLRTSLLAAAFFGNTDENLARVYYSAEMHDELAELAHVLATRTNNPDFRTALEETISAVEQFAGMSLLEIKSVLSETTSAAS